MNAKKIGNFLVMRSAFTQRNFTSLFLVAIFFACYVFAGGDVTTGIPKIPESTSFGNIPAAKDMPVPDNMGTAAPAQKEQALEVLGVRPSQDRQAREDSGNKRGRLFTEEVDLEKEDAQPLDKEGLLEGDERNRHEEAKLRRQERRHTDPLGDIEVRLNIKRK